MTFGSANIRAEQLALGACYCLVDAGDSTLGLEQPVADAIRIGEFGEFSPGIQQDDDHWPVANRRFHYDAIAGVGGITCFAQLNIPSTPSNQAVGIEVSDLRSVAPVSDAELPGGSPGLEEWILVGCSNQLRQVAGG